MKKPIIELINISKSYGKKEILQNLNLTIYENDRIAYLGGNGSGKSTTSEIIARVKKPTIGKIIYDPNLIIGIQFQESIYPHGITPKILINFYLDSYGQNKIKKEKIEDLLRVFRLKDLYNKNVSSLSGGQKQRLNILLALIHNPNFLILDELSTGLDIQIRREVRNYVYQYLEDNPKCGLLLVSHNLSEVSKMCNRIIFLDKGKIIVDKPLTEILKENNSLEEFVDKLFLNVYQESE